MKAFRRFGRLRGMGPWRGPRCAALFFAFLMLLVTGSARANVVTTGNTSITVIVTCTSNTVMLTDIYGILNDTHYLNGSVPLLSFSDTGSDSYNSNAPLYNSNFNNVSCNESNGTITITANSSDNLLAFSITLAPDGATPPQSCSNNGTSPVVIVSTQVVYQATPSTGPATALFMAMLPSVYFNVPIPKTGTAMPMAMVPHMIGGLLPLSLVTAGLGANLAGPDPVIPSAFGLPTDLNVMEIAEVYDGTGSSGGLFFMDLDGNYGNNIPPLQLYLSKTSSTTQPYQITGYWTALLKLNALAPLVTLPRLAIGVHPSGDWHCAVDYYVSKRSATWTFPQPPTTSPPPSTTSWLREAAGIYMLGVSGGGSFFNTFPATALNDDYFGIQSFSCPGKLPPPSSAPGNEPGKRCLVDVYNDALLLGSNVIFLTSWWDHPLNCKSGDTTCLSDYYNNKGDYIVRADMGGEDGLIEAVSQIHSLGGKVILYMEAYIAADSSALVSPPSPYGSDWQAQPGFPISPSDSAADICQYYPGNDCMAIPNTQWQDYLISRAVNLVDPINGIGVDGIFLDSWGWQMNWPVRTSSEDVAYTSQQWTAAALRFVDRLRAAIQAKNPNAIVMGENNTGELPFHWDGGSAADLSFWNSTAFNQDGGLLWASPIRYAMPNATFFVNGSGINSSPKSSGVNGSALSSVNQVIASGHNLALGPFFLLNVMQVGTVTAAPASIVTPPYSSSSPPPYDETVYNYIQSLMLIRQNYADALVYGNQLPLPAMNSSDMVAFMYQGTKSQVLAIVNNSTTAQSVTVPLDPSLGTGSWTTSVAPSSSIISQTSSGVKVANFSPAPSEANDPMGGLVILTRPCASACASAPSIYGGVTQELPLMNETFASNVGGTINYPSSVPLTNWTDWMVSGGNIVPSGAWTAAQETYENISKGVITTSWLQAQSPNGTSLLFYDSFSGGDFTYSGGITINSIPAGGAGLSFRLSDNPQQPDAGQQGYDVVLTSKETYPYTASGSVMLLKRPSGTVLGSAPLNINLNQTYQVSVTATTTWKTSAPDDPIYYPAYPSFTTFKVFVDGVKMLSATDASYFSGRFGVNSSYANAQFTCLQATDGPPPPACQLLPPPPFVPPPPPLPKPPQPTPY